MSRWLGCNELSRHRRCRFFEGNRDRWIDLCVLASSRTGDRSSPRSTAISVHWYSVPQVNNKSLQNWRKLLRTKPAMSLRPGHIDARKKILPPVQQVMMQKGFD